MSGTTFTATTDTNSIFKASNEFRLPNGFTLEDIVRTVVAVLQTETQEPEEQEDFVAKGAVKSYKDLDDYPPYFGAKEIQQILGISHVTSYALLNSKDFPTNHIGRRKVVSKEAFFKYLRENEGKQISLD